MIVERYLTPRELSELCGIQTGTLAAWRCRAKRNPSAPRRGPEFVKLGERSIRYPQSAVAEWLAGRDRATATSTETK